MTVQAKNPGPAISVVIGAFNAADSIAETIHSVLEQRGPDFEVIVVDDGSADATPAVIGQCARGADNLTLLRNEKNLGLTASLVRGCARARGKYIARIDVGDRFLPGRLQRQYDLLESQPRVGLVSCGTRFVSAEGEWLYDISQQPQDLAVGLQNTELQTIAGPSHHGSTMFCRDVYEAVGGYRPVFRVAQDLDLWLRISEACEVLAMPEILYQSAILSGSISVGCRQRQIETARVILGGAKQRRRGEPEPDYPGLLAATSAARPLGLRQSTARYEYFVGGCLAPRDRASALKHFGRAWRQLPWHPRYALKYWMTRLT